MANCVEWRGVGPASYGTGLHSDSNHRTGDRGQWDQRLLDGPRGAGSTVQYRRNPAYRAHRRRSDDDRIRTSLSVGRNARFEFRLLDQSRGPQWRRRPSDEGAEVGLTTAVVGWPAFNLWNEVLRISRAVRDVHLERAVTPGETALGVEVVVCERVDERADPLRVRRVRAVGHLFVVVAVLRRVFAGIVDVGLVSSRDFGAAVGAVVPEVAAAPVDVRGVHVAHVGRTAGALRIVGHDGLRRGDDRLAERVGVVVANGAPILGRLANVVRLVEKLRGACVHHVGVGLVTAHGARGTTASAYLDREADPVDIRQVRVERNALRGVELHEVDVEAVRRIQIRRYSPGPAPRPVFDHFGGGHPGLLRLQLDHRQVVSRDPQIEGTIVHQP